MSRFIRTLPGDNNRERKLQPMSLHTYLYSKQLLAEEVLRLRAFLLRRTRLRLPLSPASQVEQQYEAASIWTSFAVSISDSRAANKRGASIIPEAQVNDH